MYQTEVKRLNSQMNTQINFADVNHTFQLPRPLLMWDLLCLRIRLTDQKNFPRPRGENCEGFMDARFIIADIQRRIPKCYWKKIKAYWSAAPHP